MLLSVIGITAGSSGSGAQGAQGFQGPRGFQGFQGFQGVQGPRGFQGFQGFQGVQGLRGFQGFQGFQGAQGFQGFEGTQGFQGFQGVQGVQGFQGPRGFQGFQGFQGPRGFQGFQGIQGPQGFQGFEGVQGFQGFQGAQGVRGFQGFQGPQGFQGTQGPRGFQGFQGDLGPEGLGYSGLSDSNETLTVGTGQRLFETLSLSNAQTSFQPGTRIRAAAINNSNVWMEGIISNYTENSLTFESDLFNGTGNYTGWTISVAGEQGNGPQGFQGVQGSRGFQGFQGAQGTRGFQGFQGFQGVQGPRGFQGFQGFQGPQGDSGNYGGDSLRFIVDTYNGNTASVGKITFGTTSPISNIIASTTDADGASASAWFTLMNNDKGSIRITRPDRTTEYLDFTISSLLLIGTSSVMFVNYIGGNVPADSIAGLTGPGWPVGTELIMSYARRGPQGLRGSQGFQGPPAAGISGTLNRISKFTPSGSVLGNSSISDNGLGDITVGASGTSSLILNAGATSGNNIHFQRGGVNHFIMGINQIGTYAINSYSSIGGGLIGEAFSIAPNSTSITLGSLAGPSTRMVTVTSTGLLGAQTINVSTGTVTLVTGTEPIFTTNNPTTTPAINIRAAGATTSGVITIGTQTIAGDKTFNGSVTLGSLAGPSTRMVTVTSTGLLGSQSISAGTGTVTGVTGTEPIFISGSPTTTPVINVRAASTTTSGVITTGVQTIAGLKTFNNNIEIDSSTTPSIIFQLNNSGTGTISGGTASFQFDAFNSNGFLFRNGGGNPVLSIDQGGTTTLASLAGLSTRMVTVTSTGLLGSQSISAGTGTVTLVTGTEPIFISGSPTTTPVINVRAASTTTSGVITTGVQTIAGNKTFSGQVLLQSAVTLSALAGPGPENRMVVVNSVGTLNWETKPVVAGTSNYVAKFIGTNAVGNSSIFDNGSGVSIGGTNPGTYKLFVTGTGYFNNSVFMANGGALNFTVNGIFIKPEQILGTWSDLAFYTNSLERMRITASGSTTFLGSVTATGFFNSSDARLKDVTERDGDTVKFTWKDKRDDKTHIGYIAQEVQEKYPDQVNEDKDGLLTVNYIEVLVAKIQELENRIKQLEK